MKILEITKGGIALFESWTKVSVSPTVSYNRYRATSYEARYKGPYMYMPVSARVCIACTDVYQSKYRSLRTIRGYPSKDVFSFCVF